MTTLSTNKDVTIEKLVKDLIAEALESGTAQNVLAVFPAHSHIGGSFAEGKYAPEDKYIIQCEVELSQAAKLAFTVEYRIETDKEKGLVGKYFLAGLEVTAKKLSEVMPDILPDNINVTLNEVGFTKAGGRYEQLYHRNEHKEINGYSPVRMAFRNIKEDLALMVRALYSREPSLVRYRRSVVVPDIVLVMITAATLEIATGVLSKAYSYVSSLIAK